MGKRGLLLCMTSFCTVSCATVHDLYPSLHPQLVPCPSYLLTWPQVTRALRTRLSYASYKATHNIHHASIRDLEAQSQSQSQAASFSRTIAAKRKASASSHSQGHQGSATGPAFPRKGGSAAMPPPASTSSPRTYYPAVTGATTGNSDVGPSTRYPTSNQSLYTSILAPPPIHHARTIHNAGDSPVPAPVRPAPSPRVSPPKTTSRSPAEKARSHVKGRKSDTRSNTASPRRKAKRPSVEKGKPKQRPSAGTEVHVDRDGDVDMKAAATLTSLLLHHRPSIGSVSSPRSSIDGSEAGSAYSFPHFQQSSARTISTNSPDSVPAVLSASTASESSVRIKTPPPAPSASNATTPRPAPADSEAANLMLFLATSPSPARPANKDSRDAEAFRALGGGPGVLREKGRVLFASTGPEPKGSAEYARTLPLGRSGDNSFTSSISSIGSDMMTGTAHDSLPRASPSQLLPPPPLPSRMPASSSPPNQRGTNESPRPVQNQGSVEFNFNDFIHGSPSPLRGTTVPGPKANLGLRADVGRKLFEEEQMRHALSVAQSPGQP